MSDSQSQPCGETSADAEVFAGLDTVPSAGSGELGYAYYGPDVGNEWAPNHPIESGEMPDAEDVEEMTFGEFYRRHCTGEQPETEPTPEAAPGLVARLRNRRKIMFNTPLAGGGYAKLIDPEDLDWAVVRLEAISAKLPDVRDTLRIVGCLLDGMIARQAASAAADVIRGTPQVGEAVLSQGLVMLRKSVEDAESFCHYSLEGL